jgi:O-antigen ligase
MIFSLILWLLIWGGMFTDTSYLASPDFLHGFKDTFQGTRAFFPLLALYLSVMWIAFRKSRFPYFKDPLGFLFAYGLLGVFISFILSTDVWKSAYWAGNYLAPLMVFWMVYQGKDNVRRLRVVMNLNYGVFMALTLSLLPSAIKIGRGLAGINQLYTLPLGLGLVNRNGVGRYALIVIIVSAVRLISQRGLRRLLWLLLMGPALYLLAQTESRTSLLGLAVVMLLYFLLRGINLKFLLFAPVGLFLLYSVGFQSRAHGSFDQLIALTGRQNAWMEGIAKVKMSPFLGGGFNADRIMLNGAHMHNSYLHAAIQEGLVGMILFLSAILAIWALMIWKNVFRVTRDLRGANQNLLIDSVLIVGFLTSRSFFESTAAFFGIDLLLMIPAMAFISIMLTGRDNQEPVLEESA